MVQAGPAVGREGAGTALPGVELANRTRTSRGVRRATERRAAGWPGRQPASALAASVGGIARLGGRARPRPRESRPQARGSRRANYLLRDRAGHCDERPLLRLCCAVRLINLRWETRWVVPRPLDRRVTQRPDLAGWRARQDSNPRPAA